MLRVPELCELRDLFKADWPHNCVGSYTLDNFIRWLQRDPNLKNWRIIVSPKWRVSGAFAVVDRYQLFVGFLKSSPNGKEELLQILRDLDWTHGYKVSSFAEHTRQAVLDVVKEKQLDMEYDSLTVMYHMTCKEALRLSIQVPAGYELRPLSLDDARSIDELWPNRHEGSLFLVKRLIEWNTNMGVYVKETQELVAWCLRLQGGFLGALQVKESHKRRGLGALVTVATSQRIAATLGDDVMALVNATNLPSRGMFDKLGFRVVQNCYWLRTWPTTSDSPGWPDGE